MKKLFDIEKKQLHKIYTIFGIKFKVLSLDIMKKF